MPTAVQITNTPTATTPPSRRTLNAILEIGQHVPKDMFLDWLENGLQLAERHRRSPADLAREEERIEAAVYKHGSIIEAMRAGAL